MRLHSVFASRTSPSDVGLKTWYFSVVSTITLLLTLTGFSDNLFTDVNQPSNHDPKFIIHGLFCLAWMLLFVAQAYLVRHKNIRLHRTLGITAMIVAIGVTFSTVYVFWAIWKGWDAMGINVKANRLFLPSFSVLVLLAWFKRKRAEWHKRLIYVATLFMLGPVLSRSYDPLVVSWMEPLFPVTTERLGDYGYYLFLAVVWGGLFLSLFVYDWVLQRRIHPVTLGSVIWFGAIYTIVWLV